MDEAETEAKELQEAKQWLNLQGMTVAGWAALPDSDVAEFLRAQNVPIPKRAPLYLLRAPQNDGGEENKIARPILQHVAPESAPTLAKAIMENYTSPPGFLNEMFSSTGTAGPFQCKLPLTKMNNHLDLRLLDAPAIQRPAVDRFLADLQQPLGTYMFMGVSGSGKTSSIFSVARTHFVMYIECCEMEPRMDLSRDAAFLALASHVATLNPLSPTFTTDVDHAIEANLLARLTLLLAMLQLEPNLNPIDFLLSQLQNGGKVAAVARLLLLYKLEALWLHVTNQIDSLLIARSRKARLVFCIDEANVGYNNVCLFFPSSRKMMKGIASPLVKFVAHRCSVPLIISGTRVSLASGDHVRSDVGKRPENQVVEIRDFPALPDGLGQLQAIIDMPLPPHVEARVRPLLQGRPRLLARAIELMEDCQAASVVDLECCVRQSVALHRQRVYDRLRKYSSDDMRRATLMRFCDRLLASVLLTGRRYELPFSEESSIDLMNLGLCSSRSDGPNSKVYVVDELFAVQALASFVSETPPPTNWPGSSEEAFVQEDAYWSGLLQCRSVNSLFTRTTDLMSNLMDQLGDRVTARGNVAERVEAVLFLHPSYQNTCIADTPLFQKLFAHQSDVKKEDLPAWVRATIFTCTQAVTSPATLDEFADEKFLAKENGKLLFPRKEMRPDGVLMLCDGKERHAVVFASAFYSDGVPSKKIYSQERSTMLSKAYFTEDGASVNKQMVKFRTEFERLGLHALGGALRIHFVLPRPAGGTTYLVVDKQSQDVIINIDLPLFLQLFEDVLDPTQRQEFQTLMKRALFSPKKRKRSTVVQPNQRKQSVKFLCHRMTKAKTPCLKAVTSEKANCPLHISDDAFVCPKFCKQHNRCADAPTRTDSEQIDSGSDKGSVVELDDSDTDSDNDDQKNE